MDEDHKLALLPLSQKLPAQPLVDPVTAYLATLGPKSQRVVKERLATVARMIGVDPSAMPWHELRAHHLDYIRGRLGEEDPTTKKTRAPATINLTLAAQQLAGYASVVTTARYDRRFTHQLVGLHIVTQHHAPAIPSPHWDVFPGLSPRP